MGSDTKFFVGIFGSIAAVVVAFCVALIYQTYMRTTYLEGSVDPIAAACAFDSGDDKIPPSCMAFMLQQKEDLR